MNKTQQVLAHLENNVGITTWQAIELYGATRLSAIIFNLKKKGNDIYTISRAETDRNGNMCQFVEYRLKKDA